MSKTRVAIPFSQRGPIPIHLEDSYTGSPTGCSVIDVIFPQGEEISEVRFRWGMESKLEELMFLVMLMMFSNRYTA